jgi:hypothetical protein
MEVFEVLDEEGKTLRWDACVVSMYEAYQRLRRKEPIVKRDHGPGKCFLFSLANGDVIELDKEDGYRGLFIVRTIEARKKIRWVAIDDARKLKDIDRKRQTAFPTPLRNLNCLKMTVDPMGRVRRARD